MDATKEAIYTEAAKEKLQEAQSEYGRMLERLIREQKTIPGDEVIEITASDIESARRQLRPIGRNTLEVRNLVATTYAFIGGILALFGFFYNDVREMLSQDPKRLMIVAFGLTFMLLGIALRYVNIRVSRLRRYQEQLQNQKVMQDVELENRVVNLSNLSASAATLRRIDVDEIERAVQHLERLINDAKMLEQQKVQN